MNLDPLRAAVDRRAAMRCRSCWSGVAKLLYTLAGAGKPALSQGQTTTPAEEEPIFLEEDSSVREARAALAFPLFGKFQPDFHQDKAINITGLKEMCMRLALDISEIDLERIFAEVDCDVDGSLSLAEFCEALRTTSFFASLALAMTSSRAFRVGRAYDYTRSTRENYTDPSAFASDVDGLLDPFALVSPMSSAEDQREVAEAHKALGPSDGRYSPARTRWQHAVVLRAAPKALPQAAPWVFVTLSHPSGDPRAILRWLSRQGLLPVRPLLPVNAALFAHCMPELPLCMRQGGGSALVQEEAELLERLVLELAVARKQNVWLRGLPRETGRLYTLLRCLRARHVGCRVGVLDVRVDAEAARRRHRAAIRETGRGTLEPPTPPNETELSALASIAEFVARVEYSSFQPVLQSIWQNDTSGSWAALGQKILAPVANLPLRPPLRLQRNLYDQKQVGSGGFPLDLRIFGPAMVCAETARRLAGLLGRTELNLALSEARVALPGGLTPVKGTKTVARLYGSERLTARTLWQHGIDPENFLARLVARGGFLHLGVAGSVCIDVATQEPSELLMQFGPPEQLPSGFDLPKGLHAHRWQPVTDEALWMAGMRSECWLEPGDLGGEGGAFAYLFSEEVAKGWGRTGALYRVLVP